MVLIIFFWIYNKLFAINLHWTRDKLIIFSKCHGVTLYVYNM